MMGRYVSASELKNERPAHATGREVAFVLTVTAALVLAANVIAGIVVTRWSPNLGYALLRTKWTMLQTLDRPVDILVLGDSSGNQGVAPDVLTRRLGRSAINLATIADATAVNDAWMVEQYIARFGPPRAVVLVHTYDMWCREPLAPLIAEIPLHWGYWNELRPPIALSRKGTLEMAMLRYAPLYSRQESLLMLLRGWVDPRPHAPISHDGFMAVPDADPQGVAADMREHEQFTHDRQFTMSNANRDALFQIRSMAKRHGFEVFLAAAPLYEGLYQNSSFRAHYAQVEDALVTWSDADAHWHYLFDEPMLFPDNVMMNVDHLTSRGADRYSERLAELMAPLMPPDDPLKTRVHAETPSQGIPSESPK